MQSAHWAVMLAGTNTILAGLLALAVLVILLLAFLLRSERKKRIIEASAQVCEAAPAPAAEPAVQASTGERGVLSAVVSAALAEYMGPQVAGLRIRSIRRAGEPRPERGALTAAVSAALAEYMGPEVTGLRIRSIRRTGEPRPERGALAAILSAAIASHMGEDVQGIRILSVRRQ